MARSLALSGESLATLPAALAERWPAAEAVVGARGRLTFRALADRSAAVARGLAARGVVPGTHVGLLAPNCPEWLVIALALWRCGAVLVPLSTLYRSRELHHALALADVELLISVRGFLRHDYLAMVGDALGPPLREVVWLDLPQGMAPIDLGALRQDAPAEPTAPTIAVDPAVPSTIFFTSGTMALPKGVVHSQGGLLQAAYENAAVLGLTAADRTWGYLPFFFAGGLVSVALATLVAGGCVVLQEVFEPGETLGLLERERVTVFFAWPHQAEALVAHPDFTRTQLRIQKGVGANTKWADRIYPPDHQAVGSYGMTETPPICTAWPWDAPLERRRSSHGPPVGSRELRICDPATGAPVASGTEGEICVRGPTLFLGYYREDPAKVFDPDGYFHTGDLGRVDEFGALHFLGRLKDVIKSAGVNIAAAEVEAVLLDHPAVAAAHVVGVPDVRRGEDVAAFVVLKAAVTIEQLLAHCREALATYKVPRHLWIRREDALPLKGSGKVDKPRLREEAAQLTGATTGGDPR